MLTACAGDNKPPKSGGVSQDRLQIFSSIKPIQAIVLAIAGEHADVEQLIPDYASPHDYSFKPSDIRKIEKADIIFRIDEHMETQLNGAFQNIDTKKTSIVSLASTNGLMLLDSNHNHGVDAHDGHDKEHEEHDHHDEHEHHDDHKEEHSHKSEKHDDSNHGHDHDDHKNHDNVDFHIWTSPKNAVLMANNIAVNLSKLDPKNAQHYKKNIELFFDQIKARSEEMTVKLTPFKDKPYIVFHNSWQYLAAEFGLKKPIVIDLHESVSSGAKTISDIRKRIETENINCVFYDSSISLGRLNTISKTAKTVEIDVLARDVTLNQSTYVNWLKQLGSQIQSCFSK